MMKLSAYFHDGDKDTYGSHYFTTKSTRSDVYADLYFGLDIMAIRIDDIALGIRRKGIVPSEKTSKIARTFWFGGSCTAPQTMSVTYTNQTYDTDNFINSFNSAKTIIWNLSEFEAGDFGFFTATSEIHGSIANEDDVTYHVDYPYEKVKQKCIIEPNADITFQAGNNIILHNGFYAKSGSHFHASICPQINILSTPEIYELPLCYSVVNVSTADLDIYYRDFNDPEWEFIGGYNGTVYGGEVCFGAKAILPPVGEYKCIATFYNDCQQKTYETYYTVFSKSGILTDQFNNDSIKTTPIYVDYTQVAFIENQYQNNYLSVFPNPNTGVFKIELINSLDLVSSIIVMNNLGNVILIKEELSSGIIDINLTNHPRGIYFIKVQAGNQLFTEKIIYR